MGKKDIEKNIKIFDSEFNDITNKLGDTSIEMEQIPKTSSNKILKEVPGKNTWCRVKGFLKWLFTEFF